MAGAVLSYLQDNEHFLAPWEPVKEEAFYTLDYQKKNIRWEQKAQKSGQGICYYLTERTSGLLVGKVSMYGYLGGNFSSGILGYKLHQDYVGLGYMTEGLGAFCEFLFRGLNIHRLEINIMPRNKASLRVAEKLGFRLEGEAEKLMEVNGVWEDHLRFGKINPWYTDKAKR